MRARDHVIQAERPFHYHLLSAENVDVIKQSAGCNQFTTPSEAVIRRHGRLYAALAGMVSGTLLTETAVSGVRMRSAIYDIAYNKR